MYSWAEMLRLCPQLGHTLSARTNRSLMSMCPHSSHFSQASAGISSFTRSEVRGLRSFLNQAIRAIEVTKRTICERLCADASPDDLTHCPSSPYPDCRDSQATRNAIPTPSEHASRND